MTKSARTWWILGLILSAVVIVIVSLFWPRGDNLDAALAANLRGIGHMERYEYADAAEQFEAATIAAPQWTDAKINLAIALFNQDKPDRMARARAIFEDLRARDPKNAYAPFCLGIICSTRGPYAEAYGHFQAASAIDPDDAHTLFRLGLTHPAGKDSAEAMAHFEAALARNPYLNAARYNLALALNASDPVRATKLFAEHKSLADAAWEVESGIRYGEMGRYAEVIGRPERRASTSPLPLFEPLPGLRVTLAAGAKWAAKCETMVLFDFNNDQRPDILLLAAAEEAGRARDVLLRNDGEGVFTDVTTEAGLSAAPGSRGGAAGDFDNDGFADLIVTSEKGVRLFRNRGNGTFEDVSTAAGVDQLAGSFQGCGWLDMDQDADLDLLLCGPEVILFENVGIAAPGATGLSVAFQRGPTLAEGTSVVLGDVDADRDVDAIALNAGKEPTVVMNDRLLRFRKEVPAWGRGLSHAWTTGLVLDANHDERSDLLLLRSDGPPLYLLSKGERDFVTGTTNAPTLRQAVMADVDLDGWPDVLALDSGGGVVLLRNSGDGRLQSESFYALQAQSIGWADVDGDHLPDVVVWSDGLRVLRNRGNGNAAVLLWPTGRRDRGTDLRSNADGIGVWAVAQTGAVWAGVERTTVAASLGQSLLPTPLAIGRRDRADVVRLRWPDAMIQAELSVPAGWARITETNRKGTSCPVLLAWDGFSFVFVTDFLGAGALGESGPDGSIRPPRGEESVKIEPEQLQPRGGEFILKITEPMDEVLYLDHLELLVVDHPANHVIYPDERFVFSGEPASQRVLGFAARTPPRSALDQRNQSVLPALLERDRKAVDTFKNRSWLGYAEDHTLTLDFPEVPGTGPLTLVLAGWTDYPYPESMLAASRAGVALQPPTLEHEVGPNQWKSLGDLGFPAGLPRVMTRALPSDYRGGRLRLSTNMQVYWDQIHLARAEPAETLGKVQTLRVSRADLAVRGFLQEIYPGGSPPVAYDDAKTEAIAVTRWKGHLTRLGDVTDLLRAADDRLIVCGPGDEITVRFAVSGLGELTPGWKRSYIVRTLGYCKDTATTTVTGGEVGPLPFRAMPNYPDFGTIRPSRTDASHWQTRPAGGR